MQGSGLLTGAADQVVTKSKMVLSAYSESGFDLWFASNANGQNGRFSAPLRAGGNIDFGFFTYSFGGSKSLAYR